MNPALRPPIRSSSGFPPPDPSGEAEPRRAASQRQPPSPQQLSALVESIASSSDKAAFASLYLHFAPRVKSYLARRGAPPALAEDLAQETMLSVWRKAAYFDAGKANVSTWVFTIARNLAIDQGRRGQVAQKFLPDPADLPDDVVQPDDALVSVERSERVREAMQRLSPEQMEIVRLFFFLEQPHSEISRSLGIPLGTVKSRVRLALARLKTLLDDLR